MRRIHYNDQIIVRVDKDIKKAAGEILKGQNTDISDYVRECLEGLINKNKVE